MTEPGNDPLAAFGEATARPATDTTTRMKGRLDVYVAQERSRGKRKRRQAMLFLVMLALVASAAAAVLTFT